MPCFPEFARRRANLWYNRSMEKQTSFDRLKRNLRNSLGRAAEAGVRLWAHPSSAFFQGFLRASLETRQEGVPSSFFRARNRG